MTTIFKSVLFKVLSLASILLVAFTPLSTFAQYGGGTSIGGGTNSNSIQVTVSNSDSQSAITIVNGKRGDVVNLTIPNSAFGVLSIRFTLGADVNNAVITLRKASLSEIFSGLDSSKKPVVLYAITLSGISYEQIQNFNFRFRLTGLANRGTFEGFSSNSPWISASLSSSNISNDEVEFNATTPIAFRQFTVSAQESNTNTATTTSTNTTTQNSTTPVRAGEVLGASDSSSATKRSSDDIELIRTGMSGQTSILGVLVATISFVLVSFLLYKSNKRA